MTNARNALATRELTFIRVAGRDLPAYKAICPQCHTLNLHTDFDTKAEQWWMLTCPEGHQWMISITEDA